MSEGVSEVRAKFAAMARFPSPLAHLAVRPDGFDYHWMQFQYIFDLPDPYAFPALDGLDDADRETLRRYVRNCLELAESTLLSHDGSVTVTSDRSGTASTLNIAPREALRGVAVLFRLVGNDKDVGGFGRARKVLERRAAEQPAGDHLTAQLKRWRVARNRLGDRMLRGLVAERLFEDHLGGHPASAGDHPNPRQLIAIFGNGDLIHQGTHLEAFEKSSQDPIGHNFDWFNYASAVLQLSHFYLGYAVIVDSALGDCVTLPPAS